MQSEEEFLSPNVQLHGADSTATPPPDDIFGDVLSSEPFKLSDFLHLDIDENLWVQGDIQNRHPNEIHVSADHPQNGICPNNADVNLINENHRTSSSSVSRPPVVNGRSKSESLTESEWEAIFDIVFPLYLKKSLAEILRLLKTNEDLCPSRKQLKTKIQLWHEQARLPHKNIDKSDMDYMVLVAHLRENQGLRTAFKHYGFLVHGQKLERHKQRWGVNFKELNPDVSPEHITWDVPSDSNKSSIFSSALQRSCGTSVNYSPPSGPTDQPMMTSDSGPFKDASGQSVVEYMDEVRDPKEGNTVPGPHDQAPGTSTCFILGPGGAQGALHFATETKRGKEYLPKSWMPPSPKSLQGSPSGKNCDAKPSPLQAHRNKRSQEFNENKKRHTVREQPNELMLNHTNQKSSTATQRLTNIQYVEQHKYELHLEPESPIITYKQLVTEVKSIYAGLTMVESKCIHVGTTFLSQSQEHVSISPDMWVALVALHRTLLHEHHDFFLTSQHPNASPSLRRLANKYSMDARMFKHGCLGLLELMRKNLPQTLDYMITFIEGIAYPIFALMFETVPALQEFWAETLGDLARYRMAIEECDPRYREIWSATSRSWYRHTRRLKPGVGRIQYALGILSISDDFEMLSFFSKSVTSEQNYPLGKDTILDRLKSTPTRFSNKTKDLQLKFRNMHLALRTEDFATAHSMTLGFYSSAILTQFRSLSYQQGLEFAIVNIASLFNYGNQSPLRYMLELANLDLMIDGEIRVLPHSKEHLLAGISEFNNQAICCKFIFNTFLILLQLDDCSNTVGHILALLTFLCSLGKASKSTSVLLESSLYMVQQIFNQVPWKSLCFFLNKETFKEFRQDQVLDFPGFYKSGEQPLPEDWDIRGLIWTVGHFPSTWFDDKGEPEFEDLKHGDLRKNRIQRMIYLARVLCIYGYMSFEDGLFSEVSDSPINCISSSICTSKQEETFHGQSQILGSDQRSCSSSDTASLYPWSTPNTTETSSTSPSSLSYQFPDDK